jgi:hypothetical protein
MGNKMKGMYNIRDSMGEDIFNSINFASRSKNLPQHDNSEQGILQGSHPGLLIYWTVFMLLF